MHVESSRSAKVDTTAQAVLAPHSLGLLDPRIPGEVRVLPQLSLSESI